MGLLAVLLLLPGETGLVESKVFTKAVQTAAVTATVRIVNDSRDIQASGVIIKQSGPFVYILTAGHVAQKGDSLTIDVFTVKSHPKPERVYRSGEVLERSLTPDLAIIRLATRDVMPGVAKLCSPRTLPEGKNIPGLAIGCGDRQAPTCLIETLAGKRRVIKPGEREGAVCWEVGSAPEKGRSGGPLFDRRGNLIGLASGIGDGKGYYTHIEEIHAFLKRSGLKWISE